MNDFLKKLKLIDYITINLAIDKATFVSQLKNNVKEDSFGIFSDLADIFSSDGKEYKGIVTDESFTIKKKRTFFGKKMRPIVKGTYKKLDDSLVVVAEINGFSKMTIPFIIMLMLFYMFFIGIIITEFQEDLPLIIIPFILIHVLFTIGIPYYMMRKMVKNTRNDLEKKFTFIASKIIIE